jgi:hypothetical protein
MTHTFGIEIETHGASIPAVKAALSSRGIRGCEVKPDGTPGVDAEIVLPPLASGNLAWDYIHNVCSVLEAAGCNVNRSCGLHVHISNAPLDAAHRPNAFSGQSIAHKEATGRYITGEGIYLEPLDALAVKDIMQRYSAQQDVINRMHPASRTDNRYCQPLSASRLASGETIRDLNHGKFYAVNLETWQRGTIEFRQAAGTIEPVKIISWVQFLLNLVDWTVTQRVEAGEREQLRETPEQPFRRGARIGVIYTLCRQPGGATVRDLMNATGTTEQNIRGRISEIRDRVGDAAVITHTQQANGASYGDGTDLARYEVLASWTERSTGARLVPENRRGMPSVWAGMGDVDFEWWQDRIHQLDQRR